MEKKKIKALLETLTYFSFFSYAPSIEQAQLFYPYKISHKMFEVLVQEAIAEKIIIAKNNRLARTAQKKLLSMSSERAYTSAQKLQKRLWVIQALRIIPWVHCISVSGSVAVGNARPHDDIDLFVIAGSGRLWLTRLFIIVVSSLFGVRRSPRQKHAPDKLCFNLFFASDKLTIPQNKMNEYVAHEILQMYPIVNKKKTYEAFLAANQWVSIFFPNAAISKEKSPHQKMSKKGELIPIVERLARALQLWYMRRHRTTELVTDGQLWFFPDDFEKKIRSARSITVRSKK